MAAKNGSKATVQQVYDLLQAMEDRVGRKIDGLAAETRYAVSSHSVELAVFAERQVGNVKRLDGLDGEIACLHDGLDDHTAILRGKPPESLGLMADMDAMKKTRDWVGRAALTLSLSFLLGVAGVLWALVTHKIVIVEAASNLLVR